MATKRTEIILILLAVNLFISMPIIIRLTVRDLAFATRNEALFANLAAVVVLFLVTLGALWGLSKIGGPLQAEVKASITKFGGKIWVTAAGLVGCFLAIVIVGVAALYILARIKQ